MWNVILIAIGLGADAMSVSAAVGVRWHGPRHKFRLAWHMGLFQFLMPILGWLLGRGLADLVSTWGKYVAAAMVFGLGLKMFIEVIRDHAGETAEAAEHAVEKALRMTPKDPTRGWSLMMLSVATSLDAMVAGLSIALQEGEVPPIWQPSLIIGFVAGGMSLVGVYLGQFVGKKVGRPAELVGALVLMGLGVSFVVI